MARHPLQEDDERRHLVQIQFQPLGRRAFSPSGQSLMETARQLGIDLVSLCGGSGKCGRCKVKIIKGNTSPISTLESQNLENWEIRKRYRLACQTYPNSDVVVQVLPESLSTPQRVQIECIEEPLNPDPLLKQYKLHLTSPSLSDLRADDEGLIEGLRKQYHADCSSFDIQVLRTLSTELRSLNWHFCATLRGSELISIGPLSSPLIGLAVDMGTTKVAGYLVDLQSGSIIAGKGAMNRQIPYGEDIITRINLARRSSREAKHMQQLAVNSINDLISDLTAEVGMEPQEIIEAVIVGNTAMHHLLLHLPLKQLAYAPYVPTVSRAVDCKARELGLLISPSAYVHFLPNIAGFVGGDHVAMILSTEIYKSKRIQLALDIGTNTEICLVDRGEMTCVSCASGPAFEGVHITSGMRAGAGAIEHVRIANQVVEYSTIGGKEPTGICGSGILDAVAQLFLAGVLDMDGKMLDNHPNVRSFNNIREFVIASETKRERRGPTIAVTQKDVRELQLAKAAIRSGIEVLLKQKGLSENQIDQVIVAGAFGSFIDISSAVTVGMLPNLPLERFQQVGNAAGAGARLALLSQTKRAETQRIAHRVGYLELASEPNFRKMFLDATAIGLMH